MFALILVLLVAVSLAPTTVAQSEEPGFHYTVWSSVVFNRIGDRTPDVLGRLPTTLTSLGARQSFASGALFRERYLARGQDGGILPIHAMSPDLIDPLGLYVRALDTQSSVASAQAFVQGLYPPFTLNVSTAPLLDPTSIVSNNTYVEAPLDGYQYPQIHVSGALDPDYVYLGGTLDCPAFDYSTEGYATTSDFAATQAASKALYQAIGPNFLTDVLLPDGWDYSNAYPIYDYLNYQATHNSTIAALLDGPRYVNSSTNTSYLDTLRFLSDHQQHGLLCNMSAYNSITERTVLPDSTPGSISTIAGNLLAAVILNQLEMNIETSGQLYKLSLLFGDFQPLLSLFALMSLPAMDMYSNFSGMPDFASAAAFELYSWESSTNVGYPSTDNLYVTFLFRNGTDPDAPLQAYPTFNRGPDQTDMPWATFQQLMYEIMLPDVGDWCTQCGAVNLFCAAWNTSLAAYSSSSSTASPSASHPTQLSPAAAGAVGAVLALVLAALLAALLALAGGWRLHRLPPRRLSKDWPSAGGFKGAMKLSSDRDLVLPTGPSAAAMTPTTEQPAPFEQSPAPGGAHERTGSWEMKGSAPAASKVNGTPVLQPEQQRRGLSERGKTPGVAVAEQYRDDEPGVHHDDDFDDDMTMADSFRDPVRPDERV